MTTRLKSDPSDTRDACTDADPGTTQALADQSCGPADGLCAEAALIESNEHLRLAPAAGKMVTWTRELERRVHERTAQLEATNRELEAFAYSVSHDLRAPLRSIRGFSEVLLERYSGQLDAEGQGFLRRVCDASHRMNALIDDLLKLSRIDRSELRWQPVNLSALAEEIAAELRKADPARTVEVAIEPNLRADDDERLLGIVLDNLLRNAWKFTRDQPRARIEFGFSTKPEPAFFVRDNGVGFDMAHAGQLFGFFQRLHSMSDFPGTGVGLAIVQRGIQRHRGRVWATGVVNQGATSYFALPETLDFEL